MPATAPVRPEPDEPVAASPPAEASAVPVERALPEIEYPIGQVRQGILDHLLDSEGPQTVAQFIAALGNFSRGTVETALKREFDAGRIERVAPGTYVLAKSKPPEAPKRPSASPPPTSEDDATWFVALEAWAIDSSSWDTEKLGPRPNEPGRRIPADIVARGVDRSRKRAERRREAEAAAARQAAADRELRDKLLAAANGNFQPGPALDDMTCIREVLKTVPLDRVIMTIKQKVDRRSYPGNPPLTSWRDPSFLRAIAEDFCRVFAVSGLVREWGAAGKAPATKTHESSPPAAARGAR
jgi:hypothetical protein